MRNVQTKYACYPSVVPVGREVEVTVVPVDNSRIFREDKNHLLGVVGLGDDLLDYNSPVAKDHSCYVKEGCLCFKHSFEREQEYSIRFAEEGGKETRIPLYAVQKDLYERRPLKGDLHSHSYYSDGSDGIAVVPADYREEGFDFFALTDHNRRYPSELLQELFDGVKLGICMIHGEEVHTPGSKLHIVHVGGKESICHKYIHSPEAYEEAVSAIEEGLPHIPQQYRRRVAMAHWACREIHKAEGLAIFAHPLWRPNIYNISKDFCQLLFEERIFDGFELVGCAEQPMINVQHQIWLEQKAKGNVLAPLGSSDSHNHDFGIGTFAKRFTVVFAKDNTADAILEAIKEGYCLAAEIPKGVDGEVRFYGGDSRLTFFAQFLWKTYFPQTWRLAFGEGVLMRRYVQGEDVGQLLDSLADTVSDFYKRFYGLLPPVTVNAKNRAFLDKALKMQREIGPKTKGADLGVRGGNERRE